MTLPPDCPTAAQPPIDPIEPTFEELPAMELAGLAMFGGPSSGLFPKLWSNFQENIESQPGLETVPCYGVELYPPNFPKKWEWTYVAAGKVIDASKLPRHLLRLSTPASTFAVFRLPGSTQEAMPIIGQAFRYIYDRWLPTSGYINSHSMDMERYDWRKSSIEILVPIKKKRDYTFHKRPPLTICRLRPIV